MSWRGFCSVPDAMIVVDDPESIAKPIFIPRTMLMTTVCECGGLSTRADGSRRELSTRADESRGESWSWGPPSSRTQLRRMPLPGARSCRCLTTDSLPRGYPGQLFGLRRVLELDGKRRDSRFILVRALDHDRVITLRPVGVSLCIGLIVLSCLSYKGAYNLYLYR
jgi:hypothetical protein